MVVIRIWIASARNEPGPPNAGKYRQGGAPEHLDGLGDPSSLQNGFGRRWRRLRVIVLTSVGMEPF